jgi:MarR family transcriptional regulator, organic hydroperoxide resistance regulator
MPRFTAAARLTDPPAKRRIAAGKEFHLERHIFYLFGQIFGHRNAILNRELRRFDVDYPRWRVLALLNERPDCSMLELADGTAVDRTTLAYTVRNMVEEGLVRRTPRPSDRRSVVLGLTPRGNLMLKKILPTVLKINDRCLSGFDEREVQTLLGQLRRIIDNIKEKRRVTA